MTSNQRDPFDAVVAVFLPSFTELYSFFFFFVFFRFQLDRVVFEVVFNQNGRKNQLKVELKWTVKVNVETNQSQEKGNFPVFVEI